MAAEGFGHLANIAVDNCVLTLVNPLPYPIGY